MTNPSAPGVYNCQVVYHSLTPVGTSWYGQVFLQWDGARWLNANGHPGHEVTAWEPHGIPYPYWNVLNRTEEYVANPEGRPRTEWYAYRTAFLQALRLAGYEV